MPAAPVGRPEGSLAKTAMQLAAIACLAGLFATIAHKALHDVGMLSERFPGLPFWRALGRYFLANLAG